MRFAERVNTIKDAKEFIKMNNIKDYEVVVLWEEE
jgi:hypothetical protein